MLHLQSIEIKPRDNQFVNSWNSESRSDTGHLYFDTKCSFIGLSRADRAELDSYHGWTAYDWLSDIGLDGLIGRQIKTPAHGFKGEMVNTSWLSESAIDIELQTAFDNYPLVCVDPHIWPTVINCGTEIKTIGLQAVDHYEYLKMSSSRQRRVKKLMGTVSQFSGDIHFDTEQFKIFLDWYRCHVNSGGGQFTADWLVHREIGAWKANFGEVWSAKFDGNTWTVSINLVLVKDSANEAWAVWELEDAVIDGRNYVYDVCKSTELLACLYNRFNNRANENITEIKATTESFVCLYSRHNDRAEIIINDASQASQNTLVECN